MVKSCLKEVEVFIGVGSNLGDREKNITQALKFLQDTPGVTIEKVSSVIETEPQGGPPQSKYLNRVIKIKTTCSPQELLRVLQNIENRLGRVRKERFGPRTIDLDILLYGERTVNEPNLKIPHPRMWERDFVLTPLLEIEPGMRSKIEEKKQLTKRREND